MRKCLYVQAAGTVDVATYNAALNVFLHSVDVNVVPDKRKVLLENEQDILSTLQEARVFVLVGLCVVSLVKCSTATVCLVQQLQLKHCSTHSGLGRFVAAVSLHHQASHAGGGAYWAAKAQCCSSASRGRGGGR